MIPKKKKANASLSHLGDGVLQARFEEAFLAVVENIEDPNMTDNQRKITMEVKLTPVREGDATQLQLEFDVKHALAKRKPYTTQAVVSNIEDEVVLKTIGREMPGQIGLLDTDRLRDEREKEVWEA